MSIKKKKKTEFESVRILLSPSEINTVSYCDIYIIRMPCISSTLLFFSRMNSVKQTLGNRLDGHSITD